MTDLCPHDLTPAGCITCRAPKGNRRRIPAAPGPTFTARYVGDCPGCGFEVVPGQEARRYRDRYWHSRCAEIATP